MQIPGGPHCLPVSVCLVVMRFQGTTHQYYLFLPVYVSVEFLPVFFYRFSCKQFFVLVLVSLYQRVYNCDFPCRFCHILQEDFSKVFFSEMLRFVSPVIGHNLAFSNVQLKNIVLYCIDNLLLLF